MLCALIMAGGKGTRFWPLSTEEKPKQFLKLISDETMIQMTVNRIKPIIPIDRIFICTGERYVALVKEQLPELPEKNIIIEPEGRNTAPCIALSALVIKRYYKDAKMIVLPSDHLINNETEFRNIIKNANRFIRENNDAIITLGMHTSRPETNYGYIKYGEVIEKLNGHSIVKVDKFVEKPNLEKAEEYLEEGCYLWNGGMFMWSIENIIKKIKKYSTDTYEALHNIEAVEEEELQGFINKNYCNTEAISIDYAVLEKSDDIYVIPSDIGWDDVGSWEAIERYRERDSKFNILESKAKVIESSQNTIITKDKKIIMIGVDNVLALETKDGIYIINKSHLNRLSEYKEKII